MCLSRQCLARRIPEAAILVREVAAWCSRRNSHNAKATWHFTSAYARVKLKSLYPAIWQIQATRSRMMNGSINVRRPPVFVAARPA